MRPEGELVSDTAWLRTYQLGPNHFRYESKFLVEGLEVDAGALIASWPGFSARQRWEFALAYFSKPAITAEDERILDYLMSENGRDVWEMLPIILTRHTNRDRVIQFLDDRICTTQANKANYYQALGIMQATEAGPRLQGELASLEARMKASPMLPANDILDFIACVEAIFSLTKQETDLKRIKPFLTHPDALVRLHAKKVLDYDKDSR